MVNLSTLSTTMVELFLLVLVGYGIGRSKSIDSATNNKLSWLIASVLNPCLIIASVLAANAGNTKNIVTQAIWIGWLIYALLIAAVETFCLISHEENAIYKLLCIFANTGFIGYPILRALYGDFAVFVFSILHMPFNVLFYLYGVKQVQRRSSFSWQQIINPGLIASILALCIYFFNIPVPEIIAYVCDQLGNACIPLSMVVIGISLSFIPIKTLFSNRKLYIYVAIKLLLFPFLFFLLARVLPCSNFMKQLLVLSGALPTGAMVSIIANQYNYHEDLASASVFLTTLLSVITIPLMCTLLFPLF